MKRKTMLKRRFQHLSSPYGKRRTTGIIVAISVAAIAGVYAISQSQAATFVVAGEAENGILAGNAAVQAAQAGASGSSTVQFKTGSTGGGGCPGADFTAGGSDGMGGCFPGPHNTGYPHGLPGDTRTPVTLTAYTGPCTITAANTVIDSKTINCGLDIQTSGVVIKNSLVKGSINLDQDLGANWSVTVQDTEVVGAVQQISAFGFKNLTAIRANLHGGQNALQCQDNCVAQDSWLHGQDLPSGANWHLDGFITNGGNNIKLLHSVIACDHAPNSADGGCSADIGLFPDFAPVTNVTIDRSLIFGTDYAPWCLYGPGSNKPYMSQSNNIIITNNIFQKGSGRGCGAGYVTSYNRDSTGVPAPGSVWTNNKNDAGAVVNP